MPVSTTTSPSPSSSSEYWLHLSSSYFHVARTSEWASATDEPGLNSGQEEEEERPQKERETEIFSQASTDVTMEKNFLYAHCSRFLWDHLFKPMGQAAKYRFTFGTNSTGNG